MLALACQFVLSFAHVHAPGFGSRSAQALSSRLLAQVPVADQPVRRLPAAPAPSAPKRGDDLCPICALIHLAQSLIPAESPALPPPIIITPIAQTISTDGELILSLVSSFRARAPPLA
jgi:hypothetical protein